VTSSAAPWIAFVGVDDATAGDVDDDGVGRKRLECGRVDQPARGLGERTREHEDVGLDERREQRVVADDLVCRPARGWAVAHPDRLDVEPGEPRDDRLADRTQSHDGDGAAGQLGERLEPSPLAASLPPASLVESADERQYPPEDVLGDVGSVDTGGVRDGDPPSVERVEREVVDPGGVTREELERRGVLKVRLGEPLAGDDGCACEEPTPVGGGPSERDGAVRESPVEDVGVLGGWDAVCVVVEHRDVDGGRIGDGRLDGHAMGVAADPQSTAGGGESDPDDETRAAVRRA
jgi:hypothetical protein